LRAERTRTISVCVPAREEAATIARVVASLVGLRENGVIDEVVVVDADSRDGTAAIAAELGADVYRQAALLEQYGPVLGKGDAMWRALSVLKGDLVCFLDADSENFGAHFACGLLGPLVCEPDIAFVKGHYRRPFNHDGAVQPTGGGRVTALTARPLLQAFYPELAGVHQPLAGEIAARRDLLTALPFSTGYAVEIALLLDVHAHVGLAAMAQVDLDVRQNRHQPLSELEHMAATVLATVTSRLRGEGRLLDASGGEPGLRRPPLAGLRAAGGYTGVPTGSFSATPASAVMRMAPSPDA
jgi:glucosyl-3-phosphoglycerate synthase